MRITLSIDNALLAKAQQLTGIAETSARVREALSSQIERESARRLTRLGGTDPGIGAVPRDRLEPGWFL
ncbi:DUF2191 domain-containing protein [Burkholderia pyrrocinia]|uniref:DUF2191 domain-containing protein n=1 Tax=Burkholderia pyrrocinia TaxID=60550 RepID=A0A2Z5N694_BURPY|nr:type II toxin-antitoxin system VapB family antitoxin [Burkholderia pyrrocinia]AXF25071.1 DUF2191 domain-containing protein [Burkholderia pyrrocinia]